MKKVAFIGMDTPIVFGILHNFIIKILLSVREHMKNVNNTSNMLDQPMAVVQRGEELYSML